MTLGTQRSAVPIPSSPSPGKYSSDLSPAFLLNLPYVLIPAWAGARLFQQPKALPCFSPEKVSGGPERGGGSAPGPVSLTPLPGPDHRATSQKCRKKCRKMRENARKCREMQGSAGKCRENA